jgi:hypothetical protein
MKKLIPALFISVLLVLDFQSLFAQNTNLVFFSEGGERFSVVLNGILQNPAPVTNVMIKELPSPSYKAKILFEDKSIPELNKNLMFQHGTETTFCIKKNSKGEYVVRFLNQVAIEQAPPPPPAQQIIMYTTVPAVSTTITTQTQTTTSIGTGAVTGISAEQGNISMNISTGGTTTAVTTTSTTQTTTVATSGGSVKGKPVYEMPGYSGPVGCPYPMSDLDFRDVKNSIASKTFEDSKLTIAKQVISANCLFASEVRQIMQLFTFESSRLEFAKYAFPYTFDQGNYYKLNDAFQFESSIDELNEFIRKGRR